MIVSVTEEVLKSNHWVREWCLHSNGILSCNTRRARCPLSADGSLLSRCLFDSHIILKSMSHWCTEKLIRISTKNDHMKTQNYQAPLLSSRQIASLNKNPAQLFKLVKIVSHLTNQNDAKKCIFTMRRIYRFGYKGRLADQTTFLDRVIISVKFLYTQALCLRGLV